MRRVWLLAAAMLLSAFGFAQAPVGPGTDTIAAQTQDGAAHDQDGGAHDDDASSAPAQIVAPSEQKPACAPTIEDPKKCQEHWKPLLIESGVFLTWQNGANLYSSYWYRWETTHGKFWKRYLDSVQHYAYSKWADGNPLLDDYVGHPMMGSITNYLWIQNDPRGAPLEFGNNREYWHSRLRALAYSTVYSTEWKLGPIGEASVGHNGDHVINENNGRLTTDTGFVSLVTTPVGGTLWTTAEDMIDRYFLKGFQERHRHPMMLTASSFLNPTRSAANLMRLRAPWYRDSRVVRSSSFWSKPVNENAPIPGGNNELGFWSGLSMLNGHVFGFSKDVYQATWDVRYSRLLTMHPHWALRYAPEVEVLTMLSEPVLGATDRFHQRKRTYGSGVSPVGFQMSARPHSKWQPFASTNGGFDYFADRILSPQASQMMFSIDLGGGVQYFRTSHSAITLGYRYHHISNANISNRNPGVDSNIFLVGISRFR